VDKCYKSESDYLKQRFDNLTITVTGNYYIPFVDENVKSALATAIGDGIGVTESDLSTITSNSQILRGNTSIVDFPEYAKVGKMMSFSNCSNLETLGFDTAYCTTIWQDDNYYYNCGKLHKFVIYDIVNWYNSGTSRRNGNRVPPTEVSSRVH